MKTDSKSDIIFRAIIECVITKLSDKKLDMLAHRAEFELQDRIRRNDEV